MPFHFRHILFAGLTATVAAAAQAADYSTAANYNNPYGMTAGQENQAINPSLRDSNGNLTIVNGQFTSSSFSHASGVGTSSATSTLSSLGSGSSGVASYSSATAIGNSLNVVTVGSYNTVIVNSTQINNGNQTATVTTK